MLLAIDIGNSNINFGIYDEGELLFVSRILTEMNKTEVEYAVLIHHILHLHRIDGSRINGAIISSVVPPLTPALKAAVQMTTPVRVLQVGPGVKTGLKICTNNPGELGADFVASSVGAIQKYPLPAAVIDLGTATKISVVDENHTFAGCSIMPGVMISLDALSSRANLLPHISLEPPVPVIGLNTVDCMKSGVILGAASMIDGMLERYEQAMGPMGSVIACGGLSSAIIPYCKRKITIDNRLLLDGLYAIWQKNCGSCESQSSLIQTGKNRS